MTELLIENNFVVYDNIFYIILIVHVSYTASYYCIYARFIGLASHEVRARTRFIHLTDIDVYRCIDKTLQLTTHTHLIIAVCAITRSPRTYRYTFFGSSCDNYSYF